MIKILLLIQLSIELEKPNYKTHNSNQKTRDTVSLINQNFYNDIGSQIQPSGTNNEISGCVFKNITSTSTTMNNFIKATGPLLIYNNVFESDELLSNQPGILWYNTNSNLAIVNCSFIRHNTQSSSDGHILTINSDNYPNVNFESCKFIDCSNTETKTLVKLSCSRCSINFTNCLISFNHPSVSCKILTDVNPNVIFDRCNIINPGPNAIQITQNTVQGQFKFTKNHIQTVNTNLIDMAKNPGTIEMSNNVFEDVSVNGQYFIKIIHSQEQISLNYNTFSNFTAKGSTGTSEIKGGGISTFFHNQDSTFSITYDHCTFLDIKNEHQTGTCSYGGAIQIGLGISLSSVTVSNSVFKENRAYLHGGALAIQAEGEVSIINCTFENNVADNKSSSSSSFLDEKADGRGGAIYLNPTFTQSSSDKTMSQATIKDCKFSKNIAYGGYAIYIDGKEDATTVFSIENNRFLNNHDGKGGECTYAAIDSEVTVLDAGQIEKDNDFSIIDNGSGSKLIVFVDHSGNILPDPIATPRPTPFKTPVPVEGTATNFIDKVFEGTNFSVQIRPGSTKTGDIQNVKQVSGCYFKNIRKIPDTMNNFIRVYGESSFFNNVIENDEVQQDEPGVIWLNSSIKFTLLNCKFIRCSSRLSSGDGCILTVNEINSPEVIFESCEFIDCAYATNESLVQFNNQGATVNFTDCIITFGQTGCQIVKSLNPQVVFDRCQITGCVSNAINLRSIPSSNTNDGTFQFTNNIVRRQTNNLINIANLISNPIISHNIFEDVTLDNEYLIYIQNNLYDLQLSFNTFSRITTSSDSETFSGGFATFMPSSAAATDTETVTLTYDNCNFYDIENLHSNKPYYQGGAIQCGFSAEMVNLDLTITNCVFKRNQAFKHGGALAIQIQGSVTIRNCTFEENRANCNQNQAKILLYEDNSDKKEEGRGGAIYINPTFVVDDNDKFLQMLTIENCTFKRNMAFDGFAIYIEGENSESTIYTITNNVFIDNFNGQNIESNGAVFASEVILITEEQILTNNLFSNENNGIGSYPFYHVDHSGIRFPERTPTPLPTNHETPIEEDWKQADYAYGTRCYQVRDESVESERDIVIKVEATSFSRMKELNGSAIHLVNCGLLCSNGCSFDNCGQEGSVGGAVYIYNANDLVNTIKMNGLTFSDCTADYGGAIFIYSTSFHSEVTILRCKFNRNSVKENGPSEELTGGSAIFLSIRSGRIAFCKFAENIGSGGSVKFVGIKLDETESSSLLLSQNEKAVHVNDCVFNDNKVSIFYMARKGGSFVYVTDCLFTAKLNKDDHHIDGMEIEKSAPKMIIKSCKIIDQDLSKMVAKKGKFAIVDVKSIKLGCKMNNKNYSWKLAAFLTVPAVAAIIVLIATILIKNRSTIENNDDDIVQKEMI